MLELIIALVIAVPVILFPAAFIWFINVNGMVAVWKEMRRKNKVRKVQRVKA